MDLPTVLYILYTMVSAQQTNLLPNNASRNDTIFAQKVYRIYATTSQYLSSYSCAITMVCIYIYIYIYIYIIVFTVSKALHFIISALKLSSCHKMPKFQSLVSVVSVQSEVFHTIHKMNLSSKAVDPHKHAYYKVTPRTHTIFIACGMFLPFLYPL